MSELHSVSQATVRLFGVDIVVHQLNNGQPVIEEASMIALFEALPDADPQAHSDWEALHAIFSGGAA